MDRRHSLPLLPPGNPATSRKIEERKRLMYLISTLIALPSIFFVWIFYSDLNVFIRYVYPFLIAEAVLWIGALLWRRIPLIFIEYFVLITIALFFLVKYAYHLFYEDLTTSWKEIESIAGAMLILFILGYIILEHQLALRLSMLYISLTLLIGLWKFLPTPTTAMLDWIRLETRMLVVALLTFILAKVKDNLIASQKQASYWEWQANVDHLTQLPNRRMISTLMEQNLQEKRAFAILLIDLDDFKCFNDTYGHDFGDVLLSQVAFTLRTSVRASDIASRWGGEEFLIVVNEATAEQTFQLAERLRSEVENLEFAEGRVSISIGGTLSEPSDDLSSLVKRADTALYAAKAQGRNSVCWE